MGEGMTQQQLAVQSGRWLLYRFDPRRRARGLNPLQLDSPSPRLPLAQAMASENRFRQLQQSQPERAAALTAEAQDAVDRRWALYRALATLPVP